MIKSSLVILTVSLFTMCSKAKKTVIYQLDDIQIEHIHSRGKNHKNRYCITSSNSDVKFIIKSSSAFKLFKEELSNYLTAAQYPTIFITTKIPLDSDPCNKSTYRVHKIETSNGMMFFQYKDSKMTADTIFCSLD